MREKIDVFRKVEKREKGSGCLEPWIIFIGRLGDCYNNALKAFPSQQSNLFNRSNRNFTITSVSKK
jgi:hypothetical protein